MKVSQHQKDVCRSKIRYETKNQARNASGVIKSILQLEKLQNVYKCPVCRHYHLTSMPKEKQKQWRLYLDSLDQLHQVIED